MQIRLNYHMIQTIFILGNSVVAKDRLPVVLLPKLKNRFPAITFIHIDPTEEFITQKNETLYIIDSVDGIEKVTLFSSISDFATSPRFSVHDYDLLLDLQLRKKLMKIQDFVIIGVPQKGRRKKIEEAIVHAVSTLLSKNGKHNSYTDRTT